MLGRSFSWRLCTPNVKKQILLKPCWLPLALYHLPLRAVYSSYLELKEWLVWLDPWTSLKKMKNTFLSHLLYNWMDLVPQNTSPQVNHTTPWPENPDLISTCCTEDNLNLLQIQATTTRVVMHGDLVWREMKKMVLFSPQKKVVFFKALVIWVFPLFPAL